MDQPEVVPAAPAAPEPVVTIDAPRTLADLTADERAAWRASGELPEPPAPVEPPKVEPEPVKAEEAKPEPVAPPLSKRQQQINDLIRERTAAELRAQELEQRLRALEQGTKPAAPPAPVADPRDPEPTEDGYFQEHPDHTYGQFVAARARWEARQERRSWEQEQAQRAQQEAVTRRLSDFGARCAEFAEKTPTFAEKAQPFLDRVTLGTPIGDVLADSPVGPAMALHFAEHPEEVDRIARLHPILQLRELGKLEGKIETASTSASAGPAPARVLTTAPAPVPTLGQRPAAPLDDADDAVAAGDFRRFREAANQKDLARRR